MGNFRLNRNYGKGQTAEQAADHAWWEDQSLVQDLKARSKRLKSGEDNGVTFDEVKRRLNSK